MACSSCAAARRAALDAVKKAATGKFTQAASSARQAVNHVAEAQRIRILTRKK